MDSARIVQRLAHPDPRWERRVDVVVVGSGAAGLTAALHAAAGNRVLVVTKGRLDQGSTSWAQGGLAAVLSPGDSAEAHVHDTLVAGAGLCDEAAVRLLVAEAPAAIGSLQRLGAHFDTDATGGLALTLEGGHSERRIVHAGGDASGAEVVRTLEDAVRSHGRIEVLEHAFVLDVVLDAGRVAGLVVAVLGDDGAVRSVGVIGAGAVVLASGGFGQVYASTSNPPVVTGDGLAMALRAGAVVRDLEFVQFHPTVLWQPAGEPGARLLVSEAVRGEGAVLIDASGARVMAGVHPRADLAPRDVVATAMARRMAEAPGGVDDHLWLDGTALGAAQWERRFPTILAGCRAAGIDPVREPVPVAPAAHYACGGVVTDLDGATSLPGLYAAGEVACTGLHGANRLASNSVPEALVFGERIGRALAAGVARPVRAPVVRAHDAGLPDPDRRAEQGAAMSRWVGVLREADGLRRAAATLASIGAGSAGTPGRAAYELANLHAIATAIVVAATARTESRGGHRRRDHPHEDPAWRRHLSLQVVDGSVSFVSADRKEFAWA